MRLIDYIVGLDNMRRICNAMTDYQLVVAYLRLMGFDDEQAAGILGTTDRHISANMAAAKKRIASLCPDLAKLVEGRSRNGYRKMEVQRGS